MWELLWKLYLAIVILQSDYPLTNEEFIETIPYLRMASIHLQISDQQNADIFFTDDKRYVADLNQLRDRERELKNAPPMELVYEFEYSLEEIIDLKQDLAKYHNYLLDCINSAPEGGIQIQLNGAINESNRIYHQLNILELALTPNIYLYTRRHALLQLQQAVTEKDWLARRIPSWEE